MTDPQTQCPANAPESHARPAQAVGQAFSQEEEEWLRQATVAARDEFPAEWNWEPARWTASHVLLSGDEQVLDDGSAGGEYAPNVRPDGTIGTYLVAAQPRNVLALLDALATERQRAEQMAALLTQWQENWQAVNSNYIELDARHIAMRRERDSLRAQVARLQAEIEGLRDDLTHESANLACYVQYGKFLSDLEAEEDEARCKSEAEAAPSAPGAAGGEEAP